MDSFGGDGIFCDFSVENCVIIKNENYGLFSQNGNVTVKWCDVKNNGLYGIRHQGEGFKLAVENCQLRKNSEYGIYCLQSTPYVKNSIVSENDVTGLGRAGIRLINPTYSPILHNLTVAHNRSEGIYFIDNGTLSDPNDKDWPDVQNCILWYNNSDGIQYKGFDKERIHHSCIYDPNNPQGSLTLDDHYNFSANPVFAYSDPNNVHIEFTSPCKDAGNPDLAYVHQTDMDNQPRVVDDLVDIGAYEVRCESGDISNEIDWNADGIINLDEFSKFQQAWLSHDPNEPGLSDPNLSEHWNPVCDLDGDYQITPADVVMFLEESPWLWRACWRSAECFDSYNVLDHNGDGLVNLYEYSLFASVWQTYQPGSKIWQFCNLDAAGDSQYTIDLADLIIFLDDWLWVSCTKADAFTAPPAPPASAPIAEPSILEQALQLNENICLLWDIRDNDPNMQQTDPNDWQDFMDTLCLELDTLLGTLTESELMAYNWFAEEDCCGGESLMMSGGSETLFMGAPILMSAEAVFVREDNAYIELSDSELVPLAVGIYEIVDYIDVVLRENPENAENLLEAKGFLEDVLVDIKAAQQESLDKTGEIW